MPEVNQVCFSEWSKAPEYKYFLNYSRKFLKLENDFPVFLVVIKIISRVLFVMNSHVSWFTLSYNNDVNKGFFLVDYRQPKLSINKKLIRVVSYCVILNMAVNIKDLYGNSGNRLKKIKYSLEFSIKKTLYLIYLVFFAFVWLRFLSTPCFRTSKKSLISIGSGK